MQLAIAPPAAAHGPPAAAIAPSAAAALAPPIAAAHALHAATALTLLFADMQLCAIANAAFSSIVRTITVS